jgi:hypothetical protein
MNMQRTGGVGFVTAVALAVGTAGAAAAPPHHHRVSALGGSCVGTASAIAQYCEVIPGAGGGHHPRPGTPTLSWTLPSGAFAQLAHTPALRPLLRIPAASSRPETGLGALGTANAGPPAGVDSASVWTPMVLVLAGIALLLGGLAVVRRRRLSSRLS